MEKRIVPLHESLGQSTRRIFEITAYVILAGLFIDIFKYANTDRILLYTNIITISVIATLLFAYYFKFISFSTGFTLLIYTMLLNIFLGMVLKALNPAAPERLNFFLRDSLFVFLLVALAAFGINKIHSLIIGGSYLVLLIFVTLITKSKFLIENIFLIVFVSTGYLLLVYYLIGLVEKAIDSEKKMNLMIQDQNRALSHSNELLKDSQQIIEEQTEKLSIQSEELQIKNKELIELNESKNTFLSILAHDLKNPFNLLLGFVTLLQQRYNLLTEDKRKHYIAMIEGTTIKTFNLLENLLTWGKAQTNSLVMNRQLFLLNNLIEEIIELFKEPQNQKALAIIFNPDKEYNCYADQDMIATVLRNILSNAIKFSFEGSNIFIRLGNEDDYVFFEIEDHGVGIPSDSINTIFVIGRHQSTNGTLGESGTGLGLILCKELILKNKGTIEIFSKEGKGTKFKIRLPYTDNVK